MKIIHIANLGRENYSGITEVVINLSIAQMKLGHEVLIYHLFPRCVVELESHIKIVNTYDKFKEYTKSFVPDIIIFHSIYKPQYIRFVRFCMKNNIPYLVTLHGGANKASLEKGKWKKRIANFIFVNMFIQKSQGIIYLNENEKLNDSQFSKFTKHYILNNGINLPEIIQYNPKVSNIVRFLFIGRYDYYNKGLDIFLKVIDKIYDRIKNKAVFNFYGQGEYDRLKKDTEKYRNVVSVNGPIFGKDKERILNNSDVFLLASRHEGMPISILEALGHGLPCIITRETNMAEWVKDAGIVIDCSEESLANAILTLAESTHEDLLNMSNKAIEYVRLLSWENIAAQSIRLYSSIIRNKNNYLEK